MAAPVCISALRQRSSSASSEVFVFWHDRKLRPSTAYANYYQTYIERDVRQLIQLKDASAFEKLMKLLAGRAGQLVDYSSLANDVGVDAKTVKHWLSILEASFVLYKLPPYFENFAKRAIKSPKYYFTEVGLLAYLLGLREPAHVARSGNTDIPSCRDNLIHAHSMSTLK